MIVTSEMSPKKCDLNTGHDIQLREGDSYHYSFENTPLNTISCQELIYYHTLFHTKCFDFLSVIVSISRTFFKNENQTIFLTIVIGHAVYATFF